MHDDASGCDHGGPNWPEVVAEEYCLYCRKCRAVLVKPPIPPPERIQEANRANPAVECYVDARGLVCKRPRA